MRRVHFTERDAVVYGSFINMASEQELSNFRQHVAGASRKSVGTGMGGEKAMADPKSLGNRADELGHVMKRVGRSKG